MAKRKKQDWARLWDKIERNSASRDERIDAAILAGKLADSSPAPKLLRLLEDEDGEVRYYALTSLVLDLQQTDDLMKQRSWALLREDPDEYVRGMAAACLGKILFNLRSRSVFSDLLAELRGAQQPSLARGSVYRALFEVAGRPPLEWPGVLGPSKVFEESDIDWDKVAWLESLMENP